MYGDNSIEFVEGLIHVHPFGVIGKRHDGKVKLHVHNNIFQVFIIEMGTTELQYDAVLEHLLQREADIIVATFLKIHLLYFSLPHVFIENPNMGSL